MNDFDLDARFFAAQAVARDGGRLALRHFRNRDPLTVEMKGAQDMASEADREVEALVRGRLSRLFPDDGFLGEEGGASEGLVGTPGIWVVDPIDGTAGFVVGIPVWCVSIAFVAGDEIEIGVVYDPNADEMFSTRRGRGASLDGAPIRASTAMSLGEGTVGIGYSPRTGPRPAVAAIERLLDAGGMYQCNGSCALALAYVAGGRLIGYYEAHTFSWDCLAGIALVRETGGWTNDFLAGDGLMRGNPIIVAAPGLEDAMKSVAGVA